MGQRFDCSLATEIYVELIHLSDIFNGGHLLLRIAPNSVPTDRLFFPLIGDDFDTLPAVNSLSDDQLKNVLDHKQMIESWLKSIESEIFSRIERGDKFPGYKMVEGRSIRKQADDAEEKLSAMYGDEVFEKKLKGITTIEKQLGKKHFAELNLTVKPVGKNTLVPESDSRPAISNIADDFSDV